MKRKTITLVIYMLVCISLVSVGFAAWVITGGTSTTADGGIQASTVTDKSLNIKDGAGWVDSNQIIFGKPSDDTTLTDTDWLRWDTEGVPTQKLSATYKLTLYSDSFLGGDGGTGGVYSGSTFTFTPPADIADCPYVKYNGLTFKLEYVLNGEKSETFASSALLDGRIKKLAVKEVTISVTVSYSWNVGGGNHNPYTYYNSLKDQSGALRNPTQAEKNEAKTVLSTIEEDLKEDATFKLDMVFDAVK